MPSLGGQIEPKQQFIDAQQHTDIVANRISKIVAKPDQKTVALTGSVCVNGMFILEHFSH